MKTKKDFQRVEEGGVTFGTKDEQEKCGNRKILSLSQRKTLVL